MKKQHQQTQPYRLVQLSDCHLPADPDTPYRGLKADEGLERLVERVAGFSPQHLLLTGDLSEDGSAASYRRLRHRLDGIDARICALPGNHDVDEVMRRYFPDGPWDGPLLMSAGHWTLALLRSSRPGRIDGELSGGDLDILEKHVSATERSRKSRALMLALHHQPVPVGSPWIDRYGLAEGERLLHLIEARTRIRAVVWGHVHQAFQASLGSAQLLACPSTAVNSLPRTAKFQCDPSGPACRWFKLYPGGEMETGLLRA